MSSLNNFFESDFNTLREQWENALKAELKLPEVGSKGHKKLLTGQTWPTLSLETRPVHLRTKEEWKKAANTYSHMELKEIPIALKEDLDHGVRNFFFHAESLNEDKWNKIEEILGSFAHKDELEVFILGSHREHYTSQKFKVISHLVSGQWAHDLGGHSVQELALMSMNLIHDIRSSSSNLFYIGVYLDSQFFHNIAKIRAAKLLAHKIIQETGGDRTFKMVGLTSYRDWTVFERYSNMLRNETTVASGFISGADHVQSAGYNTILELEAVNLNEDEHRERSRRMARNTSHVLALESMLGVVEDAAFGSYHLENLTNTLAEESWKLMQTLVPMKPEELKVFIEKETSVIREKRLDMMKTRRHVLSGINDFPDVKEKLDVKLKETSLFRVARIFEDMRLEVSKIQNKPSVYIALFGDYGALNARVNFVKNYFELLGLSVFDPGHSETNLESFKKNLLSRKEEIVVLCATDENYAHISEIAQSSKAKEKFIAGKTELAGFQNLFAGQNVYEILHNLVSRMKGGKS